jgi:hypothetical protein
MLIKPRYTVRLASPAVLALLLCATAGRAEDRGVAYTGGSVGDGVNGYIGAVVALPAARLGDGLALRAGASGGEYHYLTNGQRIDARYLGGELALVVQTSGGWGWANFSGGPRITDTRLRPRDRNNRLRGTRFDLGLQTDGAFGKSWRVGWFGSLGVNDRSYIAELRLGRLVDVAHATRVGAEAALQGDRNYTRASVGGFVATGLGKKIEGRLGAGISEQAGRNAQPYVSVGFSKLF